MKVTTVTVRKFMLNLLSLMAFANKQEHGNWATQRSGPDNGVYGYASATLYTMLVECYGPISAERIYNQCINTFPVTSLSHLEDIIKEECA